MTINLEQANKTFYTVRLAKILGSISLKSQLSSQSANGITKTLTLKLPASVFCFKHKLHDDLCLQLDGNQIIFVKKAQFLGLISSPEPKAQVSFSDHNLFVVRRCCKLFTFLFFSRTTGPISTKLGTNHPLVKGFQICSNDGPCPFPRENNYEIAKIHRQI